MASRLRIVITVLGVSSLVLVATAGWALGAREPGSKLRSGEQVVVPEDERVEGDLYASGGEVTVVGTVGGDLVVAGGRVSVPGRVAGDVVVAGGDLSVAGEVDGDVRAAGGDLSVAGGIAEDLLFVGGQATIDGTVGDDVILGAGGAHVDGRVQGSVLGGAGGYTSTGTVVGDEQITVAPEPEPPTVTDHVLAALRRFATLLVVGAVVLWLLPGLVERADGSLARRPLWSLGGGLLALLGLIIAVVTGLFSAVVSGIVLGLAQLGSLVAVVVLGVMMGIAALALAFAVAAAFVADAVVGLRLGRLVTGPQEGWARRLGVMALGLVPVVALTAVPVVGGWIRLLVALVGLGALLLATGLLDRLSPSASTAGTPGT